MSWLDNFHQEFPKKKIYCIQIVREFDGIEDIEEFGCFEDKEKCEQIVSSMRLSSFTQNKINYPLNIFSEDIFEVDLFFILKKDECIKEIRIIENYKRW
jgi:hypothetical protein